MSEKTNFYNEISKNRFKTILLILIFSILILFLGYILGIMYTGNPFIGLIVAVIISLILISISYFSGDSIVLNVTGAKEATKPQYTYLINTIEGLAIAAGLPKPKVWVINDQNPNAFATGRNPEKSHVAVTTGLLDLMNREELEGVIAHEMSHIKNFDIRYMMIVAVMVGMAVILSDFIVRSFLWGGDRDRKIHPAFIVLGIVFAILTPVIAELIRLAISRKREYLADASGALFTRNPQGLASALKKLKNYNGPSMKSASKATAHLFISNPFKNASQLFSTHPPLNERIKKLESM